MCFEDFKKDTKDITFQNILLYLYKKYFNKEFNNDIDLMIINDKKTLKGSKVEYVYIKHIFLDCYVKAIEEHKNVHSMIIKNLDNNKIDKLYEICNSESGININQLKEFKRKYEIDEVEIKYLCLVSLWNECKKE